MKTPKIVDYLKAAKSGSRKIAVRLGKRGAVDRSIETGAKNMGKDMYGAAKNVGKGIISVAVAKKGRK